MRIVMSWLGILRRIGQKATPYLMLEILLPGGTFLALLFFLCQRRKPNFGRRAQRTALVVRRTLANLLEQRVLVPALVRVTHLVSKSGPFERL
jgi:hypothetical protein